MFTEPYTTARDDPQYAEGMAHLQSAEWAEAVRCFEALHARYGNDPAVLRALDQARFKARLDAATHVRAKRFAFRFRPIVVGVLLVAAVLVLGVLVVQALDRQVMPAVRLSQLQEQHRPAACRGPGRPGELEAGRGGECLPERPEA